jgi:hypothetical protein
MFRLVQHVMAASALMTGPATATDLAPNAEHALWFPVGEQCTYRMYWGGLRVGEATLTTGWVEQAGRRLLAITFQARTNTIADVIFPVEIDVESLAEAPSIRPLGMAKIMRYGKQSSDGKLTFDWERGVARWEDRRRNRWNEYPVAPQTLDFTTFIFALRHPAVQDQPEVRFGVAVDDRVHELVAANTRRGSIRLPGRGSVSVRELALSSPGGLFVRMVPQQLWITTGSAPELAGMTLNVPVGKVRVLLTDCSSRVLTNPGPLRSTP